MSMIIPTTKGRYVTVDDEDFGWLSQYRWSSHRRGYAVRYGYKDGVYQQFWMHREIVARYEPLPDDKIVDHIDGDGSNNRRSNLRQATDAENSRNRRRLRNSSGFLGVIKHGNKWRAYITAGGDRKLYLGVYDTPAEAAVARDEAARQLHKDFAKYNFEEKPK